MQFLKNIEGDFIAVDRIARFTRAKASDGSFHSDFWEAYSDDKQSLGRFNVEFIEGPAEEGWYVDQRVREKRYPSSARPPGLPWNLV